MNLSDFDYHLPQEFIAQQPAEPRDSSRMMVVWPDRIEHRIFRDIADLVRPGDVFVVNNTRVFPARFRGNKPTGGKVELLLLSRRDGNVWEALIAGKHIGSDILISGKRVRVIEHLKEGRYLVEMDNSLLESGEMPLPPYIKKMPEDPERYNTVFARMVGSVAAPTAALHFTEGLMCEIMERGGVFAEITLHVGIGTFMPVRCEKIEEHRMEREYYVIPAESAARINSAERLFVVGTTATRALESAPRSEKGLIPSEGWADIFIYPPYRFKNPIDALITNFHLPKSTLLMLVSAFAGRGRIMDAYSAAIRENYRFYSFGDAMLLWNPKKEGKNDL